MYIIVKDNVKKAQEILGTNRPIKIGDKIEGTYSQLSQIAMQNQDVFEIHGLAKKVPAKPIKTHSPKNNKQLKKGNKYKSKD